MHRRIVVVLALAGATAELAIGWLRCWFAAALMAASGLAHAQAPDGDLPLGGWIDEVIQLIGSAHGLSWLAIASSAIMLVIGTMKVSYLRVFWDKLGPAKPFLAPILGLAAAILSGMAPGVSWQAFILAATSGAGAVAIHEILDQVKELPGIGSVMKFAIGLLEEAFGGAAVKARAAARAAKVG